MGYYSACRWVDNQMGKKLLLDDGAHKESVNGFTAPPSKNAAGVCNGTCPVKHLYQWPGEAVECKLTRFAGDTNRGNPKSRAAIQRDLAWRNGLTGTLKYSTRTNAKCCNPESKQAAVIQPGDRLTGWGGAGLSKRTWWMANWAGVTSVHRQRQPVGSWAVSAAVQYATGWGKLPSCFTWHSLGCRVQLWVPNTGKTSINWSKFSKGPTRWFGLKHIPS